MSAAPLDLRQDRIQDHYATFRGILSLYLTNQCNLTCDHCGTGSGPKMKTALAINSDLEAQIRRAIQSGGIKAIHLSGGEPFLRRRDLVTLSNLAREEGVPLAVNTNGYWALTVARGEAVLNALPGLSHIILSTDIYHARELPIERVADAAEAALLCGRQVDICTVTPFGREDEFTAKLDALLRARGLMHRVNRLMSVLDKAERPVPLDEALLAPWVTGPDPRPCALVNRPTVLENRSVLACVNTTIARHVEQSPLILGHVDQTPLDQILSRDKIDPLIQALRVAGPAFLASLLGQEGEDLLSAPYRQGDICGICVAVMGDPERVKRVRAQLADHPHRRAIAMAFELTTGRPQLP
jgi:hypothetical protein